MTELVLSGSVTARAGVNIALVKYWGKAPARSPLDANLPAVPSLSLTLDELGTETTARFDPSLDDDVVVLDGSPLAEGAMGRAGPVLDRVRELADVASPFRVESTNHVPTAAGLASSASGMAALAAATARCAGLDLAPAELSAVARLGSGSASRSVFGGWAAWDGPGARPVAPRAHWDVALVVAVVDAGPKPVGSRAAMERTRETSPYYAPWVTQARALFDEGVDAVERRDLEALIEIMEVSTMRMHASAFAARPPVRYWKPSSLAVVEAVETLRGEGVLCGWTMDAGPNVKVLTAGEDADRVAEALRVVTGVRDVLTCRPGDGVRVRVNPGEGA
ncbi:MAG: diphosphomevalonate decarboxylase [Myxococcota bacterium]